MIEARVPPSHLPSRAVSSAMMNGDSVELVVYGTPQTAGSKRGFNKGGRIIITDMNPNAREWMNLVRDQAVQAMEGRDLLLGPLKLGVTFVLARPKNHYGSGKNANIVKASSPAYPHTRPDATKLLRAVEDALTGTVYRDDGQIVIQMVMKMYGERPHARIVVGQL